MPLDCEQAPAGDTLRDAVEPKCEDAPNAATPPGVSSRRGFAQLGKRALHYHR